MKVLRNLILIDYYSKRSDKNVPLSNLSFCYTCKNMKKSKQKKKINLKDQLRHEIKILNYLMDNIVYQIFKTLLIISSKNMRQLLKILQ